MTAKVRRTIDVDEQDVDLSDDSTVERNPFNYFIDIIINVIWFITGVILLLLAFRFLLALLNANPNNWFADFIYDFSQPFVSPFFNLFNYQVQVDGSRFESYTLVAMVVYAVLAALITWLLRLLRRT